MLQRTKLKRGKTPTMLIITRGHEAILGHVEQRQCWTTASPPICIITFTITKRRIRWIKACNTNSTTHRQDAPNTPPYPPIPNTAPPPPLQGDMHGDNSDAIHRVLLSIKYRRKVIIPKVVVSILYFAHGGVRFERSQYKIIGEITKPAHMSNHETTKRRSLKSAYKITVLLIARYKHQTFRNRMLKANNNYPTLDCCTILGTYMSKNGLERPWFNISFYASFKITFK